MTLEDEHGLVNVILRRQTYERYRRTARMEPFVVVEGMLQKKDGVVNVVACSLAPLRGNEQHEPAGSTQPAPRARKFAYGRFFG